MSITEIIIASSVVSIYGLSILQPIKFIKKLMRKEDKMQTRFTYIRDDNHNPIGCIAYQIDNTNIYYGVSACHKNDKWSKEMGRHVSVERMSKDPYIIARDANDSLEKTTLLIMKAIADVKRIEYIDSEKSEKKIAIIENSTGSVSKYSKVKYRLARAAKTRAKIIQNHFDINDLEQTKLAG